VTASRHLKVVPKSRGQRVLDYRCDLVTQAVLGGDVEFRVQVMSPVIGPGPGTVSIRLVIEDREALQVLRTAVLQAVELADRAFGADMQPSAYKPRPAK